MLVESLPVGAAALHPDWGSAHFNVSGMFVFHPLVIDFLDIMMESFDCRPPVEAIHGAPAMRWNAGRFSKSRFDARALDAALDQLYRRDVGCYATFTNHLVEPSDLYDDIGNHMLERLARRPDLNGVIVVSDVLSRYIAEKYPDLRQTASIIKVTFDRGRGRPEYYGELGRRFNRYMVHPDDCRDMALLDKLDREKAEIIVNENCVADCPTRERHYDAYARMQRASTPDEQQRVSMELKQITAGCGSPAHIRRLKNHVRSCNLTRGELKTIHKMGFRNLKLQGRADTPFVYAYDLTRFMLEPEIVGPTVYKALCAAVRPE